jgi:hypothetical protein
MDWPFLAATSEVVQLNVEHESGVGEAEVALSQGGSAGSNPVGVTS